MSTGEGRRVGRPKGSTNKADDLKSFLGRVERMLGESDPELKRHALERVACRLLTCEDPAIRFGVWAKLMEYKNEISMNRQGCGDARTLSAPKTG
jgi:hypothetical protein